MSDDPVAPLSASQVAAAFATHQEHVLRYCCSATETLKDREEDWHGAVVEAFDDWLTRRDEAEHWESYAAAWTSFAHDSDLMVMVALACGCHPRATCNKCGPVKGKVRGTVYLRRIEEDRYFISGDAA